jgi:hypothetical protein
MDDLGTYALVSENFKKQTMGHAPVDKVNPLDS